MIESAKRCTLAVLGFACVTECLHVYSQNRPRIQPSYDSYMLLWQLYIKSGLNMHILHIQLHTTIIKNIFLWQGSHSACASRSVCKIHYPFVHHQLALTPDSVGLAASKFFCVCHNMKYITRQLRNFLGLWLQLEFPRLQHWAERAQRQCWANTQKRFSFKHWLFLSQVILYAVFWLFSL